MEKLIDGIGVLEDDGTALTGKININIFDISYDISIRFRLYEEGFEGLSSELLLSAQNCLKMLKNNPQKITDIIKEYYDTEVKESADDGYCDYIEIVDSNQFASIMKPVELFLKKVRGGKSLEDICMGIYFECDWNDEGFAIRFDGNGNWVKSGTGDIMY